MTSRNTAALTGIRVFLLILSSALVASAPYDTTEVTNGTDNQGEKRSLTSLKELAQDATQWSSSRILAVQLSGYGCWCGQGGFGKTADQLDFCCKVHDYCIEPLEDIHQNCNELLSYQYSRNPGACDAVASYPSTDNLATCKHALCLCDVEWARCLGQFKDRYKRKHLAYNKNQCVITDRTVAKSNADVIILAQDSQHISAATLLKVKSIAKDLVRRLDQSSGITFRYMWGTYASSSRVSRFVSKTAVTSEIDSYTRGTRGQTNYLKGALNRVRNKLSRITGNPAKVAVILTDGNAEDSSGSSMDIHDLEKSAIRVRSEGKLVGLLVPNAQDTQRIAELKSIVSGPNDAIDPANFAGTTADNLAKLITFRVKRWIKPVLYTVAIEVDISDASFTQTFEVLIRLEGANGDKTGAHRLYKPDSSKSNSDGTVITHNFVLEDGDIVTTHKIWIRAKLARSGSSWTSKKVTVKKGSQTVQAFVNNIFDINFDDWVKETAQTAASSSG